MKGVETYLKGCFVIEPEVFEDPRGYFFESYRKNPLDAIVGTKVDFVQDNQSLSGHGVLRGLHYQVGKWAQAKLVRVVHGKVLDVAVDLRSASPTFLKHFSIELSSGNRKQLFVPRGFAHGFVVLSETAIFSYKCDNYYKKEAERGIRYDDPTLQIDWKLPKDQLSVSQRDEQLPFFNKLKL